MQKNKYVLPLILLCGMSSAEEPLISEDVISDAKIHTLTTRNSDYHAIFIDKVIPAQDPPCNYTDRAIIVGTDPGAEALFSSALTATVTGKTITINVDGCVLIHPETTNTSPYLKSIKIHSP